MASVNKVILVGHLGKDPETRYTQGGAAVCSFSIATSEKYKAKSGEQVEKTEWHNITAFDKLGEICAQYLKKGKLVYVEGQLQTDKYTDKNGVEKYATKIILGFNGKMQMLGGRDDREDGGGDDSSGDEAPATKQPAASAQSDLDDDIPF